MFGRTLTTREKVILALTVLTAVGCGVYYGFLEGFVEDYTTTRDDIVLAKEQLRAQRATLKLGPKIDAPYQEVKDSVLQPKPGKNLQSLLIEELNQICGGKASISTHEVAPVPDAKEFAYMTVRIDRLGGKLKYLTNILKQFHDRNLLLQKLHLRRGSGRAVSNPELSLDITLAQLVRVEHLVPNDRAKIRKILDSRRSSSSSSSSGRGDSRIQRGGDRPI